MMMMVTTRTITTAAACQTDRRPWRQPRRLKIFPTQPSNMLDR
jgi:hypothetical protein